jgi:membrane protease YdiL (CAAX protease family)
VALPAQAGGATSLLQAAYTVSKIAQFAFPLLCVWLFRRGFSRPAVPELRGLTAALGLGLLVVGGMLLLYYAWLRPTAFMADTSVRLGKEMQDFGLASATGFACFAVFITLLHSLLEEYYWRWFVFGWLKRCSSVGVAMLLSSVGFAAFHLVLLAEYFPGQFFLAVLPFGLCTGIGGLIWAWLYDRTGSIYVPWLSHLIVDAGLFVIGYDLYFILPQG